MLISNSGTAESSELLVSTLRSIGDAVITTDVEANITFLNPTAELLVACKADECLGKKSWEVFRIVDHGDPGKKVLCPVQRVLKSGVGTGYLNHTLLEAFDGTSRPISYNATPLRDTEGHLKGVVLVFHCVKDRVAAQNTVERLQLIAKATNDAVWDWDLLANKVWWNDAVCTLFGYNRDEVGSSAEWLIEHVHPDDRERVAVTFNTLKDGVRYWQDEYRFRNKDGNYSVVHERGYVLRDDLGNAIRMVGTMMDVTGRRNAQDEILAMNAELELQVQERTSELREANRELESFSYSVSHDLRSPLRNILALSRILQEDEADHLDQEAKEKLGKLVSSANRMSKLIDDLLQYSRLSRSRVHLHHVDVSALAIDVAYELGARMGCRAVFVVHPDITAQGDPDLLRILFENLIGNAIKYSSKADKPLIEIGVTSERGEDVFYVRDNGAGFDPVYKSKLFLPFERLHNDQEFEGTGIGLANCARIVRRHGGRIWADGAVGKGATFYFTL